LLTGQGSFTADRIVPGALHVAFRRSDHAHALIASISTSAAAEVPGVFATLQPEKGEAIREVS
jgi:carbon-monoxide dehydrogenase large subunit